MQSRAFKIFLAALFWGSVGCGTAEAQQCPSHSHPAGPPQGQTIHCKCDVGYINFENKCMKAFPKTEKECGDEFERMSGACVRPDGTSDAKCVNRYMTWWRACLDSVANSAR